MTRRDCKHITPPPCTRFEVPTLVPEDLGMEGGRRGGWRGFRVVHGGRVVGYMVGRMSIERYGDVRGGAMTVNDGPDEDGHRGGHGVLGGGRG